MKCRHCGSLDSLEDVVEKEVDSRFLEAGGGQEYELTTTAGIKRCRHCVNLTLYTYEFGEFVDPADVTYAIVYPQVRDFSGVPEGIRAEYEKAKRAKGIDPEYYAFGLRRTLEALCIENGITSGSLVQRLKKLASDSSLPDVFVDMADYLRNLGNIGAHVTDVGVYESDTVAATEFTEAILEYLYVAPAKLNLVKNELVQRKAQAKGN